MSVFLAVYGFEFVRPFEAGALRFHPRETKFMRAGELARDGRRHHLAGVVERRDGAPPTFEDSHSLEAVLTFVDQRSVLVTKPIRCDTGHLSEALKELPPEITVPWDRPSVGKLVESDAFGDARARLIHTALCSISNQGLEQTYGLRKAFFTSAELWSLRRPFVDLLWFLAFSALEILARHYVESTDGRPASERHAAQVLCRFLREHGFDVQQNRPAAGLRNLQGYVHIRNAMFHRGELQLVKEGQRFDSADFETPLFLLLSDAIMRIMKFEPHPMQWEAWVRQRET